MTVVQCTQPNIYTPGGGAVVVGGGVNGSEGQERTGLSHTGP